MKIAKAILFSVIAAALVILLDTKFGTIPPLGKFLDPFKGFWQNAEAGGQQNEEFSLDGLKEEIIIRFDDNRIPHIFAKNNYDAYFAQGFVTAKDRLWQMDFQTRFASGRLSEVVGDKAAELDRYKRRVGMVFGAENAVKGMEKDPETKEMVNAYTAGINAYINTLTTKNYPLEFKLLDYRPEAWTNLKTALLLKAMTTTLAFDNDDLLISNVLEKFGPEATRNLFPDRPFKSEPIIPVGTAWNFKPLAKKEPLKAGLNAKIGNIVNGKRIEDGIGSNNFAISGSKSSTGMPILANDPHLDLSLPSIWYQIQITSPGQQVYGASLPGAPGVVIGFNKNTSWGVTNVDADVLDWYKVKFKDNKKEEYWHNNQWLSITKRVETIKLRGKKAIIDTVLYTHQGPVVYTDTMHVFSKAVPIGYAMRWIAHDESNELKTFYYLNRGSNYDDYRKALSYYIAPAQNFIYADNQNNISITVNGKFPLKSKEEGKFLLDGTKPENDWTQFIPPAQNPTVKNPPRGFVSSANQVSTDVTYPYYLNWEQAFHERGKRINDRLTLMKNADKDSLRSLQNDNYSILAQDVLPVLLANIRTENLNATQREAFENVKKWDKFYQAESTAASVFDAWYKALYNEIWVDEFGDEDAKYRWPNKDRTVQLITNEPTSIWFNDVRTPQKETFSEINERAFKQAVNQLSDKNGAFGEDWAWGKIKGSNVPHLAKVAGLGSRILDIGGSKNSVNALGTSNGPSWRMVVELGKNVKAYGVYPGGQSGNPGSFYYDNLIDTWANGRLQELLFMNNANQKSNRIKSTTVLKKK